MRAHWLVVHVPEWSCRRGRYFRQRVPWVRRLLPHRSARLDICRAVWTSGGQRSIERNRIRSSRISGDRPPRQDCGSKVRAATIAAAREAIARGDWLILEDTVAGCRERSSWTRLCRWRSASRRSPFDDRANGGRSWSRSRARQDSLMWSGLKRSGRFPSTTMRYRHHVSYSRLDRGREPCRLSRWYSAGMSRGDTTEINE